MTTIAGGVILGVIGLVILARVVGGWTARGHTIAEGVGVVIAILVVGAVGLYGLAVVITNRGEVQSHTAQLAGVAAQQSLDSIRSVRAHAAWCATWAGVATPDSACAEWLIDTAPPAVLGPAVHKHAHDRFADSLAASKELAILTRDVGATRLEAADILPSWNRWARAHRRADPFGRLQAARLVIEACSLGRPHHANIDADLRSMSGHTEWCFRGWSADSTIFAATAPVTTNP